MTLEQFKKKSERIPDAPGVYFFLGRRKKVLYIGKATSLRDRLRSYFVADIASVRSPLIAAMVAKAASIDWRETDSVLEALILEANLIKHYRPVHNTDLKDDKSWHYVVITKETFPRVVLVRGKNLDAEYPSSDRRAIFGPFPHGLQLKEALKLIRKIFPYRDTCMPAQKATALGRRPKACFNRHIGLCPGVCTGEISAREYGRTVRHITLLFSGKKKELIHTLEVDMRRAAKAEAFEQAAKMRGQVFALQHIQDVSLIKDEYRTPVLPISGNGRIEAYDVAHLRGEAAIGVMVVVEDGAPQGREYRTFRIRVAGAGDDPGALREILGRRLEHSEWPLPKLIVVDGAAAQMNAALRVLSDAGVGIPVVGVVKDEHHRPRELRGDKKLTTGRERDILLANSEAHRFAIGRHRRRSRSDFVRGK